MVRNPPVGSGQFAIPNSNARQVAEVSPQASSPRRIAFGDRRGDRPRRSAFSNRWALGSFAITTFLCAALANSAEPGAPGDLYVAMVPTSASKVRQFDGQTGEVVGDFVPPGSGGLDGAQSLAFGPHGNLFVSSANTDSVLQYGGSSGAFLGAFASGGGLDGPYGITFGPDDDLYVCSFWTNEIIEYDGNTGAPLGVFATGGGLNHPYDLTFGPNSNLFVSSNGAPDWKVLEYDGTTGAFEGVFADGPQL